MLYIHIGASLFTSIAYYIYEFCKVDALYSKCIASILMLGQLVCAYREQSQKDGRHHLL